MEDKKKAKTQLPEKLKKDVKAMSEALSHALQFMTKIINEDTKMFEEYYEQHGDIRWRPQLGKNPKERGEPTEIDMIMKADSLGLPVKRLIDTIAVIEQRLGGLDTPDAETAPYTEAEEKEHAEDAEIRAQRLLDSAAARKKG